MATMMTESKAHDFAPRKTFRTKQKATLQVININIHTLEQKQKHHRIWLFNRTDELKPFDFSLKFSLHLPSAQ